MDTKPSIAHNGDGSSKQWRSHVLVVVLDVTPGCASPKERTQPHSCPVSKSVYPFNDVYRVQAGGAQRCTRRMPCPPLESARTVGLAHLWLPGFLATLACWCLIMLRRLFFFLMQTKGAAEARSEWLPTELGMHAMFSSTLS